MFRRLTKRLFRILPSMMIAVLLGALFLIPCSFAGLQNTSSATLDSLHTPAPGSCDDDGCCSRCLCCHGAAEVKSLETMPFPGPVCPTPSCLELALAEGSPAAFEQPPRS